MPRAHSRLRIYHRLTLGEDEEDAPVASSSNFVFEGDAIDDGEDVEEDANAEAGPSSAAGQAGAAEAAEGEGDGGRQIHDV